MKKDRKNGGEECDMILLGKAIPIKEMCIVYTMGSLARYGLFND